MNHYIEVRNALHDENISINKSHIVSIFPHNKQITQLDAKTGILTVSGIVYYTTETYIEVLSKINPTLS